MKYHISLNKLLMVPALSLLVACAATEPTLQSGPDVNVTSEGLVRVENSKVDDAFMRPGVDFTRFTAIMVDPLDLNQVNIIQPDAGVYSSRYQVWELTDDDRAFVQDLYEEKMNQYIFERGGYKRATEPAENVLRIRIAVARLEPSAPKGANTISSSAGRGAVYTQGAGAITIVGLVEDAGTGQVIARFADTKDSPETWSRFSEVRNKTEVRRVFDFWAQLFQYRLDALNGKV